MSPREPIQLFLFESDAVDAMLRELVALVEAEASSVASMSTTDRAQVFRAITREWLSDPIAAQTELEPHLAGTVLALWTEGAAHSELAESIDVISRVFPGRPELTILNKLLDLLPMRGLAR